ncbi:MAG: glycerol-3-phosphate acyltransferase, partial [Thermomicrobium sp.]|nr:glycerol-3-phosphate acyltransferase [Thermomicrobium sp.]
MVEAAALIVTGFVLGSVPTAQLAAQLIAGVDLRERSPTVSGSGVYYLVARWAVVPVGILDITKGVLATYVPYQFG